MTWWQAVIFGAVEGLTEFLPVSSTGHLILTAKILGLAQTEFIKSFEIAIQLGAILAVLVLYRRLILKDRQAMKKIMAAFLPTAVIGFFLYKWVKTVLLNDEKTVLVSLFIGGIVLIFVDIFCHEKESSVQRIRDIRYRQAFLIGVFQALAMIPGVSRAGATILGGLSLGLPRKTVVEFSFILAVPTILAAVALDLAKSSSVFTGADWNVLLLGGFVSFVVAFTVLRTFLDYVQKRGFTAFGVYRICAALVFWIFFR